MDRMDRCSFTEISEDSVWLPFPVSEVVCTDRIYCLRIPLNVHSVPSTRTLEIHCPSTSSPR